MAGSGADDTLGAGATAEPGGGRSFAIGSQAAGRYRIERFVAAGAMGEVYAAHDLVVDTPVALKVLRPELERSTHAIERLRREIALARKVSNPHVCRLHDVGEYAGRVFLTMELLDGTTLSDRVRAQGPLALEEVERIAHQLVTGLAALHAAGIVHRDFKSSNVILAGDRAVITDFGLARSADDRDATLTAEATLLGTPSYMAPEQVEARAATPASDIYALGVVLFELLTATLPFLEDTAMATATARLTREPPAPSSRRREVPARWDAIVLGCLARDPAARPALAALLATPPRRRWPVVASALGIVGLGVAWMAMRDASTPETASTDCPSAEDRLAGAWDPITRSLIAGRFLASSSPHTHAVWRLQDRTLDGHAAEWSRLWTAACASPDRGIDDLRYAQRITCLDERLLELRSYASGLADPEVSPDAFAAGIYGEFPIAPIDECALELVLRAQVPPPRREARIEVDALMTEFHRLRASIRLATTRGAPDRAALTRLAAIRARATELGYAAGAAEIGLWQVRFLQWAGTFVESDAAATALIAETERTRDDLHLVGALAARVEHRALDAPTYDVTAEAAALDRATTIAERVGNPPSLRDLIGEARVRHAIRARRYDDAIAAYRELAELRTTMGLASHALGTRLGLFELRASHGDVPTADELRALIAEGDATYGRHNALAALDRIELAPLAAPTDLDLALHWAEEAIAIRDGFPAMRMTHMPRILAFAFAVALGQLELADRHARVALAQGLTVDAFVRELQRLGHVTAARRALELAPTDVRGKLAGQELALLLDAGETLPDELVGRLRILTGDDRAEALALADARRRRDTALGHAAAIVDPHRRALVRGRSLRALGRIAAAIPELRAARQAPEPAARFAAAAWLGIALVDAGEHALAIEPLEEAIWDQGACCRSTVLAHDARFALARVLDARDPERARGLARAARARARLAGLPARIDAIDTWLAR